ncbi:MAG: hypothetical protein ACRELG_10585 [Gemmataceae bacterium]
MSPINFERLRANYPEYGEVWDALENWFSRNWRKKYAELSLLLRAMPQVDRALLVLALSAMADEGMLSVAYRVKAPGGYLLEDSFDDPTMIPKKLPDRDMSGTIKREESDIVTGYKWELVDAVA